MKRNADQWLVILMHCGVRTATANSWAPIFADTIGNDSFSQGDLDLIDFLGEILLESDLLEKLEENLNYKTPGRLMQVWPTRFKTLTDEHPFIRNPQALAEKVYGGRLGNVNPGDAWDYRGSGLIQVTGADNFRALQQATGLQVFDHPELLRQATREALLAVIAWWEGHVPDGVLGNIPGVRKKVNGGEIGLPAAIKLTSLAREALTSA